MLVDRRHTLLALLVALGAAHLASGCRCDSGPTGLVPDGGMDSGLPPIARIDPTSLPTHAGKTWIRSEGSGATAVTELLVFESDDPANLTEETRRITHMWVDYEGNREIDLGVVEPDGLGGTGEVVFSQRWSLDMQRDASVLDRVGAVQESIEPLVVEPIELVMNGDQLEVTIGAETKSYSGLVEMIGAIEADVGFDTQAGAEAAAQLAQLGMASAEARVPGFGATGLLQIVGDKEPVDGLIDNGLLGDSVTAGLLSPFTPVLTLTYASFQDQDAILLSGWLERDMNLGGNGTASGVVSFTLRTDPADPMTFVTGSLDFDGVLVDAVYLSGGAASMTLEGNPFTIDTDVLIHLDFSDYLPTP